VTWTVGHSTHMSLLLKAPRPHLLPAFKRCLATTSSPPIAKPKFRETLDHGPSLDDFLSGEPVERIVLGNTTGSAECFDFAY